MKIIKYTLTLLIMLTTINMGIAKDSGLYESLPLQIWTGSSSIVATDLRAPYIGNSTFSVDLTNIKMINNDGSTTTYDLSNKKYIYYAFNFEYQMNGNSTIGGKNGSISINRDDINGINLLKSIGYFDTRNTASSIMQSSYSTAILDVKGNTEVFFMNRTGENVAGIYSDEISVLGWID